MLSGNDLIRVFCRMVETAGVTKDFVVGVADPTNVARTVVYSYNEYTEEIFEVTVSDCFGTYVSVRNFETGEVVMVCMYDSGWKPMKTAKRPQAFLRSLIFELDFIPREQALRLRDRKLLDGHTCLVCGDIETGIYKDGVCCNCYEGYLEYVRETENMMYPD